MPLPKDAPQNVVRGMLLFLLCAFHAISAGAIGQYVVRAALSYSYNSSPMPAVWWLGIFLISRSPISFRHRFKAVTIPEGLNNAVRFVSFSCLIAGACFPVMLPPFVEIPVIKNILG